VVGGPVRLSTHTPSRVTALPGQNVHLYFFYTFAQSRRFPHRATFERVHSNDGSKEASDEPFSAAAR
jgi:hypothetical protein